MLFWSWICRWCTLTCDPCHVIDVYEYGYLSTSWIWMWFIMLLMPKASTFTLDILLLAYLECEPWLEWPMIYVKPFDYLDIDFVSCICDIISEAHEGALWWGIFAWHSHVYLWCDWIHLQAPDECDDARKRRTIEVGFTFTPWMNATAHSEWCDWIHLHAPNECNNARNRRTTEVGFTFMLRMSATAQ